jgi:hypothetical protein
MTRHRYTIGPARRRRAIRTVLIASAAFVVGAADASAARYVAMPANGGRIALTTTGGRLVGVDAALPAGCMNNHGGSWSSRLALGIRGHAALERGRFRIQGRAANGVRYDVRGRLRNGVISGRIRLTFLDLDFVGADDSFVCDTDAQPYRATRRAKRQLSSLTRSIR